MHVPYRNSLMTTMLKDSLGGNCRTVMVANISGDPRQLEESLSTCRFAQRVACIANEVRLLLSRPARWRRSIPQVSLAQLVGGTLQRQSADRVICCVQVSINEEVDPELVIQRLNLENRDLKSEIRCVGVPAAVAFVHVTSSR